MIDSAFTIVKIRYLSKYGTMYNIYIINMYKNELKYLGTIPTVR